MTADSSTDSLDALLGDEDDRPDTEILLEGSGDVFERGFVTLTNGSRVPLRQLKARQLFAMMRIITRGGFQLVPTLLQSMGEQTAAEFANQLIALVVWAVPEAPDATLEFIRVMLDFDHDEKGKLTEQGTADLTLMIDPDMEDILTVITQIVLDNKDDLVSLGKKMRGAMEVMQKTGQLKDQSSETTSDLTQGSST